MNGIEHLDEPLNLKERAELAYADHIQAETRALQNDVVMACQLILEVPDPQIEYGDLNVFKVQPEATFELEGYTFKLAVETRVHSPGGDSANVHIAGLYEVKVLNLTIQRLSGTHKITNLADLGRLLRKEETKPQPELQLSGESDVIEV